MFHTNASGSISISIGGPSSSFGFSYSMNFIASSTPTELLALSSAVMRPSLAVQNDNKHQCVQLIILCMLCILPFTLQRKAIQETRNSFQQYVMPHHINIPFPFKKAQKLSEYQKSRIFILKKQVCWWLSEMEFNILEVCF